MVDFGREVSSEDASGPNHLVKLFDHKNKLVLSLIKNLQTLTSGNLVWWGNKRFK